MRILLTLLLLFPLLLRAATSGDVIGTISGTTPVIDWKTAPYKKWTLTGNSTPTFANVPAPGTRLRALNIEIVGNGNNLVNWPTSINWTGVTNNYVYPAQTNTVVLRFNGASILGFLVPQPFPHNFTDKELNFDNLTGFGFIYQTNNTNFTLYGKVPYNQVATNTALRLVGTDGNGELTTVQVGAGLNYTPPQLIATGGGGGSSGFTWETNYYHVPYGNYMTAANVTTPINTMRCMAFYSEGGGVVTNLAFYVATPQAGAVARVGIYTTISANNRLPSTLVIDGGQQDCSTGGLKVSGLNATLSANTWYVLVYLCGTAAPAIHGIDGYSVLGYGFNSNAAVQSYYDLTQTYGALPGTAPGGGTFGANAPTPKLMMQLKSSP